jgi:hypothetical protein
MKNTLQKWYDEFNFIISFLERRWLRKIYKALQEIIISGTIAIGDVTNTGELVMRLVRFAFESSYLR